MSMPIDVHDLDGEHDRLLEFRAHLKLMLDAVDERLRAFGKVSDKLTAKKERVKAYAVQVMTSRAKVKKRKGS